jgi:hypothetical protein
MIAAFYGITCKKGGYHRAEVLMNIKSSKKKLLKLDRFAWSH